MAFLCYIAGLRSHRLSFRDPVPILQVVTAIPLHLQQAPMVQCESCGRMVPAVFLTCPEYKFCRKSHAPSRSKHTDIDEAGDDRIAHADNKNDDHDADTHGIELSTSSVTLEWRSRPKNPPIRKLDSLGQPLPGDPIRRQQELESLGVVRPRVGLSCIDCRSAIKKSSGIGTTTDQIQSQMDAITKWASLRDLPSPITAKVFSMLVTSR